MAPKVAAFMVPSRRPPEGTPRSATTSGGGSARSAPPPTRRVGASRRPPSGRSLPRGAVVVSPGPLPRGGRLSFRLSSRPFRLFPVSPSLR
jgi:hypothetical protein